MNDDMPIMNDDMPYMYDDVPYMKDDTPYMTAYPWLERYHVPWGAVHILIFAYKLAKQIGNEDSSINLR